MITRTTYSQFFFINGAIITLGGIGFLFLKTPEKLCLDADNSISVKQIETFDKRSFLKITKDTIKLMFSKRMMYINPEQIWTGVSVAFSTSMIIPIAIFQLNNDPNY